MNLKACLFGVDSPLLMPLSSVHTITIQDKMQLIQLVHSTSSSRRWPGYPRPSGVLP